MLCLISLTVRRPLLSASSNRHSTFINVVALGNTASSKPIVLSFENIFLDFRLDDVPVANGPNLILSYLDLHTRHDQKLYQIQQKLPKGIWLSFDFEDSHEVDYYNLCHEFYTFAKGTW
ncbi:Uncharacterized protein Fot_56430 [Forsythia ovata]|uniref:Uncharacterized protein n=1 Tax=Forsythia ovata TaxID=205694 RepID=A0ABD1P003_9LAMI